MTRFFQFLMIAMALGFVAAPDGVRAQSVDAESFRGLIEAINRNTEAVNRNTKELEDQEAGTQRENVFVGVINAGKCNLADPNDICHQNATRICQTAGYDQKTVKAIIVLKDIEKGESTVICRGKLKVSEKEK